MTRSHMPIRVAGTWLSIASILMLASLAFHGPIAPDQLEQMAKIANGSLRWTVVHWMAAAAFSLFALTGLVVLSAGSRLTDGWWTMTAWAVLPISALWTMITAVVEATVVTSAAVSGTIATYTAWLSFAQGQATGFMFFALAVAVIAANEARSPHGVTPAWAAWLGAIEGLTSFIGWAIGIWFGVPLGSLLWLASSIIMVLWLLWFGVALTRSAASAVDAPDRARQTARLRPSAAAESDR